MNHGRGATLERRAWFVPLVSCGDRMKFKDRYPYPPALGKRIDCEASCLRYAIVGASDHKASLAALHRLLSETGWNSGAYILMTSPADWSLTQVVRQARKGNVRALYIGQSEVGLLRRVMSLVNGIASESGGHHLMKKPWKSSYCARSEKLWLAIISFSHGACLESFLLGAHRRRFGERPALSPYYQGAASPALAKAPISITWTGLKNRRRLRASSVSQRDAVLQALES